MALGGGGMGCPGYACGVARKNGTAVNGAFAEMVNSPHRTPAESGLDTGQPDVTSVTCMRSWLILARACAVRIKPANQGSGMRTPIGAAWALETAFGEKEIQ